MKVVSFNEVKDELISNMRRNMLIPIIGSGFTRQCISRKGEVPSGEDYRKHMIAEILKAIPLSEADQKNLNKETFSNVSSIYHKQVDRDTQKMFLRDNFTKVSIEENKQRFLSLPWPYVYTLNIDDGIECGSDYNHIIYANRPFDKNIFDYEKCVIKLHGDVAEMLTYLDSNSEVFSQEQYVASLKTNERLLYKLKHDSQYQNVVFIGCSLDDEIDLMYSMAPDEGDKAKTSRYICATKEPSILDTLKYEKYGITHFIVFDSFDSIYSELFLAGIEAQKISSDDLESYKQFSFQRLTSDFEQNKSYLLFGKSLLDKNHTITLPYFFISRDVSKDALTNLNLHNLQLLVGSRCSGKSYILADIAHQIRDKDVYCFETKDRLSDFAFQRLLEKKNCVILADNGAFSNYQFEQLLINLSQLEKNGINIVVVVNKNNRDINGILKLYEMQGKIAAELIPQLEVESVFSDKELEELNPLLTAVSAGIFNNDHTIVDNIVRISKDLEQKHKYNNVIPKFQTIGELSALIALGIERKVYSDRAVKLDITDGLIAQHRVAEPLIDCESTWSFERSNGDNSPLKYVVNGEYWLYAQLGSFARDAGNFQMIVDAYKYIVRRILVQEGAPSLLFGNKDASYKEYIFFDNINRLFTFGKRSGEKGLALIRVIYEGLNDDLSVDPNYMHQRSKCYIKSSYYEHNTEKKYNYLDKAYRDANVAAQVFERRYNESGNEKLLISKDHVAYTKALILCHKCYIDSYEDVVANTHAIHELFGALSSPYNSYDFAKSDSFNYSDVIGEIIRNTIANKHLVHSSAYHELETLFKIVYEEN